MREMALKLCNNQDSSVSTVTKLRARTNGGFDSRQRDYFLFAIASRPALGTTQPPNQWV
jgi:hypothetical protein